MSTLFISHSSKDNAKAKEIERWLAERGYHSVFLDLDPEKGIVGGQSWERTLYRKLRACRAVIALCTDHYLGSQWCFAELALARMEGKQIIALQLDPLRPDARLPAILTDRQLIDLRAHADEGHARLQRGLEAMDLVGVHDAWSERESPYLGLSAFDERHAPVFFGRDDESRAGIEMLERGAPGLVMVLGASGSGKSSIVRAGMVPRLRRAGGRWLIVGPFRPRTDPFAELADAFVAAFQRDAPEETRSAQTRELLRALRAAGPGADLTSGADAAADDSASRPQTDERLSALLRHIEELRQNPPAGGAPRVLSFLDWSLDDLRRICGVNAAPSHPAETLAAPADIAALTRLAEHLRRASGRREARVLLVVDQFEELLGRHGAARVADRFLVMLRQAIETEHGSVMVLGTMRSDFLGAFQQQPALLAIDFASLSVGPMSVQGMRQAIEEPARLASTELEVGLADRLLADADTADALPLLSFTLSVLWREHHEDGRLEVREYLDLGGLQGTITREADAVLELARRQGREDGLRRAFLLMVRLTEDGAYARQPVSWEHPEVLHVQDTLRAFESRRLLVTRMEKGQPPTVEVAHEALFRSWAPLRSWLDSQRGALLLAAQLRRDALAWEENQRPADRLWHGGRLQQAEELMRKGEWAPDAQAASTERRFIRSGVRRRRWARGLLVGTTAAVIAVLGVALLRASRATDEALAAKDAAVKLAIEASAQRVVGDGEDMLTARRSEGTMMGALAVLAGHRLAQQTGSAAAQAAAYGALQRAHNDLQSLLMIAPQESLDDTVRFSADGLRIAIVSRGLLSQIDSRTGMPAGDTITLPLDGCGNPGYSPGFERALCQEERPDAAEFEGTQQALLRLRDARSGQPIGEAHDGHEDYIRRIVFAPDGSRVVTASQDGTLRLWDGRSGVPIGRPMPADRESVADVDFTPDGTRMVSGGWDGTARLWNGSTGNPVGPPLEHSRAMVFSVAAGRELAASGSEDGTVRLWRLATGQAHGEVLRGHAAGVGALAFSPVAPRIVSGSEDGTLRLWDTTTGKPVGPVMRGHTAAVVDIVFSPDGSRFVSTGRDQTLLVWDARSGQRIDAPLPGYEGQAGAIAFSPDGSRLVTGGLDGRLQRWDSRARKPLGPGLKAHARQVTAVAFSPAGDRFLSAGDDGSVRVWETATGQAAGPSIKAHERAVSAAAFSPRGDRIVSASEDGSLRLWDAKTFQPAGPPLLAHEEGVTSIAYSGDGTRIVSGSVDGSLRLWDTASGKVVGDPIATGLGVQSVAFSRDNQRIAAAGGNAWALWDARTGRLIRGPMIHGELHGLAIAFSADGTRIVTHDGGTTRLWDGRSGVPIGQPIKMEGGGLNAVAFDPSGTRVAASSGTELRLWPVLEAWADALCQSLPRNLSRAQWRALVSAEIEYAASCPGKPIPAD